MYLPNVITIIRIFLVPLVVWLIITERFLSAFVVFLLAGLSDAIDGYVARRYHWRTELGAYLDPLADKFLLMGIYITLGLFGHLPSWLVIAVVSRDVLIIGAFLLSWVLNRPVEVHPLRISKLNTVGQIALAVIVLAKLGLTPGLAPLIAPMVWIAGGLTVISAGAYLVVWLRHMAKYDSMKQ